MKICANEALLVHLVMKHFVLHVPCLSIYPVPMFSELLTVHDLPQTPPFLKDVCARLAVLLGFRSSAIQVCIFIR